MLLTKTELMEDIGCPELSDMANFRSLSSQILDDMEDGGYNGDIDDLIDALMDEEDDGDTYTD